MPDSIYVDRYRQAAVRPQGLRSRGRALLRSAMLHAAASVQSTPNVPFLRALYCHYVFDDQVGVFEELIVHLKSIGTFVNTDEVLDMLSGHRPIPGPCFHLSFDDGFRNIYRNAFPVLQRHEVPAIFFVPSSMVSAGPEIARSYCLQTTGYANVIELVCWEELRQMRRPASKLVRTPARMLVFLRFPQIGPD